MRNPFTKNSRFVGITSLNHGDYVAELNGPMYRRMWAPEGDG